MDGIMIVVGSSTYAMKGKDILFDYGIKAYVERTKKTKEYGCGYGLLVESKYSKAVEILESHNIKVLAVIDN